MAPRVSILDLPEELLVCILEQVSAEDESTAEFRCRRSDRSYREARCAVCTEYLTGRHTVSSRNRREEPDSLYEHKIPISLDFLAVCKLFYRLGLDSYYGTNTFYFSHMALLHEFLAHTSAKRRASICYVAVGLDVQLNAPPWPRSPDDRVVLQLVVPGAHEKLPWSSDHRQIVLNRNGELDAHGEILSQLPRLRSLKLCYQPPTLTHRVSRLIHFAKESMVPAVKEMLPYAWKGEAKDVQLVWYGLKEYRGDIPGMPGRKSQLWKKLSGKENATLESGDTT